jgi:ABC-type Zn uptake system ZnuABC Zn-binding protein ZnuA
MGDHSLCGYFARRFRFNQAVLLEAFPGAWHPMSVMRELPAKARQANVKALFWTPWISQANLEGATGEYKVGIAAMSHQPGSRGEGDDYVKMVDYNVKQAVQAFQYQLPQPANP